MSKIVQLVELPMTKEQEREIRQFMVYLKRKSTLPHDVGRRSKNAYEALSSMFNELEGLRAFKANVDEALNSGDGVYRP